jgi:hypothetical protein
MDYPKKNGKERKDGLLEEYERERKGGLIKEKREGKEGKERWTT